MNTTPNINLSTYTSDPNDKFNLLVTFNNNMSKIDTAIGSQNDAIDVIEETANTASTTADSASTTAGNALTTANSASTTASEALTTANSASTTAGNALTTANSASTTASEALTTANSASTTAGNALTTANSASTTASNALSTANSKASINDTTASNTTTYSSNKINSLVDRADTLLLTVSNLIESETTYTISNLNNYNELIFVLEDNNLDIGNTINISKTEFMNGYRVFLRDFKYINGTLTMYTSNINYKTATSIELRNDSYFVTNGYKVRIYGRK